MISRACQMEMKSQWISRLIALVASEEGQRYLRNGLELYPSKIKELLSTEYMILLRIYFSQMHFHWLQEEKDRGTTGPCYSILQCIYLRIKTWPWNQRSYQRLNFNSTVSNYHKCVSSIGLMRWNMSTIYLSFQNLILLKVSTPLLQRCREAIFRNKSFFLSWIQPNQSPTLVMHASVVPKESHRH